MNRLDRHAFVSRRLTALTDRRLAELLASAQPLGASIGGETLRLDLDDVPVFVKKIALTDRERRPENRRSTANLFDLPPFYQYGVGSAGFGAWRELAVHELTTGWVLDGSCDAFPLTHHWRVLPTAAPTHHDDVAATTAYWEGSAAVRDRVTAIQSATAAIVVFLEYVPLTLTRALADPDVDLRAIGDRLDELTSFLAARGLVHFDAHFDNILTDGNRLYLTDFGLAASSRFALSDAEREFLAAHRTYDAFVTRSVLTNLIVMATLDDPSRQLRDAVIRDCANGVLPEGLSDAAAALVREHAPLAVVANDFFGRLRTESRAVPYPAEAVERVLRRRVS